MNRICDIYCRMPSYLKNSIYQLIIIAVSWDIFFLSPTAHILKVLGLTVGYRSSVCSGVCEELEAMAGHNMLEVLSFEVKVSGLESEDFIGSVFQKVEEILVKPGWSALGQVYFKVSCSNGTTKSKFEALKSLPDKYLSHHPIPESVTFNYSAQGRVASICKVWASNSPSQLF